MVRMKIRSASLSWKWSKGSTLPREPRKNYGDPKNVKNSIIRIIWKFKIFRVENKKISIVHF